MRRLLTAKAVSYILCAAIGATCSLSCASYNLNWADNGGSQANGVLPPGVRPTALHSAYGHYGDAAVQVIRGMRLDDQGRSLEALEYWRIAAESLESAAQEDPRGVEVRTLLLSCYVRLGSRDKAVEQLDTLASLTPDSPAGHMEIAKTYQALNKTDAAEREYRKAMEFASPGTPQWRDAAMRLAALHRAARSPDKAIPLYEELVRSDPNDLSAPLERGLALAESGDHEAAIAALLPLVRERKLSESALVRAQLCLTAEYEKAGKVKEGLAVFADLAKDDPDSAEICQSRIYLLKADGRLEEALAVGSEFIRSHASAGAVRLALAGLYEEADKANEAVALLREGVAGEEPFRSVAARQLLLMAIRLDKRKKAELASEAIEAVLAARGLSPAVDSQARVVMAGMLHDRGEATKAAAILQPAVEGKENSDWRVGLLYAEMLKDAGEIERALNILLAALQRNAAVPEALVETHRELGAIYQLPSVRNESAAEAHMKSALAIDPGNPVASNELGYFYAEVDRNLDEARTLLQSALEKRPDEPAFLDSLGWVYYKLALREDSLPHLRLAVEKLQAACDRSADPVVLSHIGDARFVGGEWEKARELWEKALAVKPEPGAETIDPDLTRRKISAVERSLADELKRLGAPTRADERVARPLAPPVAPRN